MLYKVILKNYKSHLKNYIAFFACSVCTVAMLFAFWGIQDTFGENPGMNDSVYYQYDMLGDYMTAGVLVTVMTVLMMLFSQKNYIKFRLRDYQLLLVLGLRKKKFLQVFGLEYLLNWFASFVLGLLLGQGMFRVMVAALGWAAGMDMGRRQVGAAVYRNTLLAVLALMVIVFLALMTWMEGKNLGEFVNAPEKNESRPKGKRWLWMAAAGLVFCLVAAVAFRQGSWGWVWAHPAWIGGGMLLVIPLCAVFLEWFRKKDYYFRNILRWNFLYSKFLNNMLMVLVLFSVHFTILGYAANQMASRMPVEPDRMAYSYDYVWMGKEKDAAYAEDFSKKYEGSVLQIPMMRVVTATFDEQIGIPESAYQKLGGEKAGLKGQEILVSLQNQTAGEKQALAKSEGSRYRHLMPGKFSEQTYEEFSPHTVSNNFPQDMTFEIQEVRSENIIGDYTRSIAQIGFFKGSVTENVLVFSDEYFENAGEKLAADEEEPSALFLFQIPEQNRKEAGAEITAYAGENGIADMTGCLNFYDTDQVIEEVKNGKLFALIFVLMAAVDLFLCSLLIYGVKLLSDYGATSRKYDLLSSLGMKKRQRKKSVRTETSGDIWISLGLSFVIAGIYTICNYHVFSEHGRNLGEGFLIRWLIMAAGYLLLNGIAAEIYTRVLQKLLIREDISR